MTELFRGAGWDIVPFPAPADVYVVNTCTVTATGDSKSRQMLSKAHNANPEALVVAVGCYAEMDPASVSALPGVGLVIGTAGRKEIVEKVTALLRQRAEGQPSSITPAPVPHGEESAQPHRQTAQAFENLSAVRDGRTRATLKIQDGCVNFCSYCVIPYARGPLRSRPLEDVERELTALSEEGYREVVLTGIHLASYGKDLGDCDLLDVLELTRHIPGIRRVRLGSLEPKFADERFAKAAAKNEKLCRQFHLSLQSGSDGVLARMNRRYTASEYAHAVHLLNDAMPDCAVTTDVIAGFCGETQAEHAETLAFCREMGFARMHVFPFSLRPGTRAASMPGQLPKSVKEARARELIALGKALTDAFLLRQVGTVQEVLVEGDGTGYTGNYVRVQVPGAEGAIVKTQILEIQDELAIGKEIESL